MSVATTMFFNLNWTERSKTQSEDVDLMAFVYDQRGQLLSRVAFDYPNAMNAVMHSGDQKDGAGQVIDESIILNYAVMPPNVHYIVIVILVNNDKQLNAELFSELRLSCAPMVYEQDLLGWPFPTKVFVPCVCVRSDPIHFMLQNPPRYPIWAAPSAAMPYVWPILEQVLDTMIPPAMRLRTNPLSLKLTDKVWLPPPSYSSLPTSSKNQGQSSQCFVGLGWKESKMTKMDLDAHCIVVKRHVEGRADTEHIYFSNLTDTSGGIKHLGDNRTGKGDGDDERIMIDLNRLGPDVTKLLFCIKIFTPGVTFKKVDGEYARVVIDNKEVARFDLDSIAKVPGKSQAVDKASAVLFCIIERVPIGRSYSWQFKPVLEAVSHDDMKHDAVRIAERF